MSCSCSERSMEMRELEERKGGRRTERTGRRTGTGKVSLKRKEDSSESEEIDTSSIIKHYADLCVSRKTNLKVYMNGKLIYKYTINKKKDCESIFL